MGRFNLIPVFTAVINVLTDGGGDSANGSSWAGYDGGVSIDFVVGIDLRVHADALTNSKHA